MKRGNRNEHQKRAYDDGTRFEGFGYTIYVKEAPYKNWCLEHNSEYEFHYYAAPINNPSICWNRLITDFQDANAVMMVWVKRYCKILDNLSEYILYSCKILIKSALSLIGVFKI